MADDIKKPEKKAKAGWLGSVIAGVIGALGSATASIWFTARDVIKTVVKSATQGIADKVKDVQATYYPKYPPLNPGDHYLSNPKRMATSFAIQEAANGKPLNTLSAAERILTDEIAKEMPELSEIRKLRTTLNNIESKNPITSTIARFKELTPGKKTAVIAGSVALGAIITAGVKHWRNKVAEKKAAKAAESETAPVR